MYKIIEEIIIYLLFIDAFLISLWLFPALVRVLLREGILYTFLSIVALILVALAAITYLLRVPSPPLRRPATTATARHHQLRVPSRLPPSRLPPSPPPSPLPLRPGACLGLSTLCSICSGWISPPNPMDGLTLKVAAHNLVSNQMSCSDAICQRPAVTRRQTI
ncbi:hypothetical protein [Absidia glauca]|uniref:Uncharacterized protein n=1 Tax=Absidia glauca TaxID=4829 RepID=A0A168MNU0_ABSGL|nr:hypothetical protein [Absidia glauca]